MSYIDSKLCGQAGVSAGSVTGVIVNETGSTLDHKSQTLPHPLENYGFPKRS